MSELKYHDKIIEIVVNNPQKLEEILGYFPQKIFTSHKIGNGDIDIYVQGPNSQTAIFEVKGHTGLLAHYEKKQLPKYKSRFPTAKQFCITGTADKSLNINSFNFHKY